MAIFSGPYLDQNLFVAHIRSITHNLVIDCRKQTSCQFNISMTLYDLVDIGQSRTKL